MPNIGPFFNCMQVRCLAWRWRSQMVQCCKLVIWIRFADLSLASFASFKVLESLFIGEPLYINRPRYKPGPPMPCSLHAQMVLQLQSLTISRLWQVLSSYMVFFQMWLSLHQWEIVLETEACTLLSCQEVCLPPWSSLSSNCAFVACIRCMHMSPY